MSIVERKNLVVFVDVDDTFVRSVSTKRIPITATIGKIRLLFEAGATIVGVPVERITLARALSSLVLGSTFWRFLPKPQVIIDDQDVSDWRGFVQLHPNEDIAIVLQLMQNG